MKVIKRKNLLQRNKKLVYMCPFRVSDIEPPTCDWDGVNCNEGCRYGKRRTRKSL